MELVVLIDGAERVLPVEAGRLAAASLAPGLAAVALVAGLLVLRSRAVVRR